MPYGGYLVGEEEIDLALARGPFTPLKAMDTCCLNIHKGHENNEILLMSIPFSSRCKVGVCAWR